MTFLSQQKQSKTLRATSWLVMVGFVFQLGAGSCGCIEHNGWVQLFHASGHERQQAVADTDEDHSHGHRSHSHAVAASQTDFDAQQSGEQLHRPHDCEGSAICDAVLAQQVRLPSTLVTACLLDVGCKTQKCFGSGFGELVDRPSVAQFRDGPARFVTQAFLL